MATNYTLMTEIREKLNKNKGASGACVCKCKCPQAPKC